ncbi:MAG: AAA family ATPase, partial [Pseudomonadota bacterium]
MRFDRLRLCGFKSFVEPVEIEIKPGLTGVVGPNGCGKSNLVEGLRWLMGANSAKAMRASGMDEVIFAGTAGGRPARSWAEVSLEIDNSERKAPTAFNDHETITVTRRVLRRADGSISAYSINGKEVRARDVQMLFADASTGATSPALVRQGQISELINAKPTARRRFLEEAAGVTGLAARRHEAQLRLKAAADNLERLDDVIGELDVQSEQLARQARKAKRYKEISEEIKEVSAALTIGRVRDAFAGHEKLDRQMAAQRIAVAEVTEAAAHADREASGLAALVDEARDAEREAATAMAEAEAQLKSFENEAALRRQAAEDCARSLERIGADEERETALLREADTAIATASQRIDQLKDDLSSEADIKTDLERKALEADAALIEAEKSFETHQQRMADAAAEARAAIRARDNAERHLRERHDAHERLSARLADLDTIDDTALEAAKEREAQARHVLDEASEALRLRTEEREAHQETLRTAEATQRQAKETLALLDREAAVLEPLVPTPMEKREGTSLLHVLNAPESIRSALTTVLGPALSAALGGDDDRVWTDLGSAPLALPPLPEGAEPLSSRLYAPKELTRCFASIGLIDDQPSDGQLQELTPGQVLVNRSGQFWRWDGYRHLGAADSHLEELLAAAARLRQLEGERSEATSAAVRATLVVETSRASLEIAEEMATKARTQNEDAQREHRQAETTLQDLERQSETLALKHESLQEQIDASRASLAEAQERMGSLPQAENMGESLEAALNEARVCRDDARRDAGRARGQAAEHRRTSTQRRDTLKQSEQSINAWNDRRQAAEQRLLQLSTEKKRLERDLVNHKTDTEEEASRLANLKTAATGAKELWTGAQERVGALQNRTSEADRTRREAEARAGAARETAAELAAELRGARARLDEILEEAGVDEEAVPGLLHKIGDGTSVDALTAQADKLERERERMGAVNLLATEEKEQVDERLTTLRRERGDCDEAAAQLRNAVNSINREGRQRLLAAFDAVN